MGSLTREEITELSILVSARFPVQFLREVFHTVCETKIYSKGRPRVVRGGTHTYTPKNTVKFEKILAAHYRACRPELVMHPLRAVVVLYDTIPKSYSVKHKLLAEQNLVFSSLGDVDNRAKSVLDAGNGILFADDSQIVDLHVRRAYTVKKERVAITLYRAGLSASEQENLLSRLAR